MGPITETRSRDEWLTEVKRRGGRLRRRRQLTMAVVAALALAMPVGALATFLGGNPDRGVSQLVAGPGLTTVPTSDVAPSTGIDAGPAGEILTAPVEPATTTTVKPASVGPVIAPADDPVVRPATTTTVPDGNGITTMQSALPTTTVPAAPTAPPAPCTAAEFRLTVSTEQSAYGPGETVQGLSTLEKRSAGTCLWASSWWFELKVLNAAGKDVIEGGRSHGSLTSLDLEHGEAGAPSTAKQGTVGTFTVMWEPCANPWPIVPTDPAACVPFPPGTYTVVAEWMGQDTGPPARTTFQLNG